MQREKICPAFAQQCAAAREELGRALGGSTPTDPTLAPIVIKNYQGAGNEHGRIGAHENADDHGESKIVNNASTNEEQTKLPPGGYNPR